MKKTKSKTRQANGQKRMRTRQRIERAAERRAERFEERGESIAARDAAFRATVAAQAGLSTAVTQLVRAAWSKLRSPAPYADALAYVARNLNRAYQRIADAVEFLLRQWDSLVRKPIEG